MPIRSRYRLAATTLVAVMIVAVGCERQESEADQVQEVVEGFLADAAEGRGEEACGALTGDAVRYVSVVGIAAQTEASCPEAVQALSGQYSESEKEALKSATVKRVSVSGNRATIARQDIEFNFRGESRLFPSATDAPVLLVKTDTGWKIESLG